jgi:hypothetical protein
MEEQRNKRDGKILTVFSQSRFSAHFSGRPIRCNVEQTTQQNENRHH